MTSLAHSATNDHRYEDLVKEVRGFGRDMAEGRDSLPKLAHKVVRAAADGIIDTNKDSSGQDAATRLYTTFQEECGKKAIHDHTENGVKANASKLRQFIEIGVSTKFDAVDTMNRAHECQEEMRKAGIDQKPCYAGLVDVAREQKKSDTALTNDEIKGVLAKAPPKDKTAQTVLEDVRKKLEALITGDKGYKDQSPEVVAAHEQITARLSQLMTQDDREFFGIDNIAAACFGLR